MEDLIKQITDRTGVTAEKAKEMVAITMAWLKEAPAEAREQLANASGKVSGLASAATERATGAAGTAKSAGTSAVDKGKELFDRAKGAMTGGGAATPDEDDG